MSTATNRFVTELDFTKTQLAVFFIILLLAIDEINPVKIFLHVFPTVSPWQIGTVMIVLMVYVFVSEMKALIYFGAEIFFHAILSIFFRHVETIGRENIPRYGPVIFAVNHANQFMDGLMVACTCQRKVSYLMAEASTKRAVIGNLAWALEVVPVKRQQDYAVAGSGKVIMKMKEKKKQSCPITATTTTTTTTTTTDTEHSGGENDDDTAKDDNTTIIDVHGVDGTAFSKELSIGDKIRPPGTPTALKVVSIESDCFMTVDGTGIPADFPFVSSSDNNSNSSSTPTTFDVLKKIDTKIVFEKVVDKLAGGNAVGIFPEGGSHDRTDLLPLKVGVSIIAYTALDDHAVNVPIVPVGLNYFGAHRWRGRAVVEYGRPIQINTDTLQDFRAGGVNRRQVCNELLESIESSMRSVIVSTPNYETLELIHTARRLYRTKTAPGNRIETVQRQDLSRRFAEGYKRLVEMSGDNPPAEWLDLRDRLVDYQKELKSLGLKDYQVQGLYSEHLEHVGVMNNDTSLDTVLSWLKLPYQIAHYMFLVAVAGLPILFLHLPVGFFAGVYAEARRKKALAKSKVKVRAFDVMLTEKVVFCIIMVPTLWIVYTLLLVFFTAVDGATIALLTFSLPLFAYMGIIVSDAGMVEWNAVRPYLMRIFPSSRRRLARLPETRKQLQQDVRAFIESVGPSLGEIYLSKEVDWKKVQDKRQLELKASESEEEKKLK